MNTISEKIFISKETLLSFFVSIMLSLVIGLSIALVYKHTHRGINYEKSFLSTLALLSPIVTLVMFFIQGNLVLSLGLVGSLSIIRFRTPIKDTRDMVFIFWSIAVGLGCGTYNWTIVVFASILLSIIILVFYIAKYEKSLHSEYILIVSGNGKFDDNKITSWFKEKRIDVKVRSREYEDNTWEIVYEVRFDKKHTEDVNGLVLNIQSINNIKKVSLLSPQLSLPM